MKIKIIVHLMPSEIDHFLLIADKLVQSSYFVEDELYIDTCLNLSEGIFDWEKSKLPKEYFVEKYNTISNLLETKFTHNRYVYEGDKVYGHLDLQREATQEGIDYYIVMCPDISFTEYALYGLIESAKQIENEYFIITPEIFKSWDNSWDKLVNKNFQHIPYEECINHDIHGIHYVSQGNNDVNLEPLDGFKYAGWFDLFSKETYEKLFKMPDSAGGYGPWDTFTINIANFCKNNGVDIQQYVLRNEVIWFKDVGNLRNMKEYGTDGQIKMATKNFLSLKKDRGEQRFDFESNMQKYIQEWVEYAKKEKII